MGEPRGLPTTVREWILSQPSWGLTLVTSVFIWCVLAYALWKQERYYRASVEAHQRIADAAIERLVDQHELSQTLIRNQTVIIERQAAFSGRIAERMGVPVDQIEAILKQTEP